MADGGNFALDALGTLGTVIDRIVGAKLGTGPLFTQDPRIAALEKQNAQARFYKMIEPMVNEGDVDFLHAPAFEKMAKEIGGFDKSEIPSVVSALAYSAGQRAATPEGAFRSALRNNVNAVQQPQVAETLAQLSGHTGGTELSVDPTTGEMKAPLTFDRLNMAMSPIQSLPPSVAAAIDPNIGQARTAEEQRKFAKDLETIKGDEKIRVNQQEQKAARALAKYKNELATDLEGTKQGNRMAIKRFEKGPLWAMLGEEGVKAFNELDPNQRKEFVLRFNENVSGGNTPMMRIYTDENGKQVIEQGPASQLGGSGGMGTQAQRTFVNQGIGALHALNTLADMAPLLSEDTVGVRGSIRATYQNFREATKAQFANPTVERRFLGREQKGDKFDERLAKLNYYKGALLYAVARSNNAVGVLTDQDADRAEQQLKQFSGMFGNFLENPAAMRAVYTAVAADMQRRVKDATAYGMVIPEEQKKLVGQELIDAINNGTDVIAGTPTATPQPTTAPTRMVNVGGGTFEIPLPSGAKLTVRDRSGGQ